MQQDKDNHASYNAYDIISTQSCHCYRFFCPYDINSTYCKLSLSNWWKSDVIIRQSAVELPSTLMNNDDDDDDVKDLSTEQSTTKLGASHELFKTEMVIWL